MLFEILSSHQQVEGKAAFTNSTCMNCELDKVDLMSIQAAIIIYAYIKLTATAIVHFAEIVILKVLF